MARHTEIERVIALAALYQALEQVLALARTGQWDDGAAAAVLSGLFVFDAPDAADVYGGAAPLRRGLRGLQRLLVHSGDPSELELIRLAVPVLHLERSLHRRSDLLERIGQVLTTLKPRLAHTPAQDDDLITPLAELYQRTLSTLEPRIRVRGEPQHLGRPEIAARIRALLLAAVRAAVLWRQCGGSRLHLLLRRSTLARCVRQLLQPASASRQ